MTHDPRIIALAKDQRTLAVLPSIIISGGGDSFVGKLHDVLLFSLALVEHGLRFGHEPMRELLAYVRSVADDLVASEIGVLDQRLRSRVPDPVTMIERALRSEEGQRAAVEALMLAVLRGEDSSFVPAADACRMTDALVDAGLLLPDEPPRPLEITRLGRAVLVVLEQRSSAR